MKKGNDKVAPRSIHKLTEKEVSNQRTPGRYGDGGGLWLYVGQKVSAASGKSWVFRWTPAGGKRRELGLGGYPTVSLASARTRARECREAVAEGRNPLAEKQAAASQEKPKTFGQAADGFIAIAKKGFRNEKHASQWTMTLSDAYCKNIRNKPVADVSTEDVLKILAPIWSEKNETASRLRARIERVLNYARTKGWRAPGENPAAWRGNLENTLPKRIKLQRGHHAAMPYQDVGELVKRLRASDAMAARALELCILCASRSGEVLGAVWSEIDLDKAVWTIPAKRMKAGKEHKVPLSKQAVALLATLHEARTGEYVFPGERPKKPLSSMAMTMLLRRLKLGHFTVHGLRSSFRDFCGDETTFAREIAETALAHKVGDATEQAYRRSSALEKRRELMQVWADYLDGISQSSVVSLPNRRSAR